MVEALRKTWLLEIVNAKVEMAGPQELVMVPAVFAYAAKPWYAKKGKKNDARRR